MTNPSKLYKNRAILSNEEIADMLEKADDIPEEFFRLRVKALIAFVKKFGKRRLEVSRLKRTDIKVLEGYLNVVFTVSKKHKKGLFQYLKTLKEKNPEALNKPYSELVLEWKDWTQTEEGYRIKVELREKRVSTEDRYAKLILEYLDYLEKTFPAAEFVFPSGCQVFDQEYVIRTNEHLSGRQLLRLIKPLNYEAWLHLFRETRGAEIAREYGDNLAGVFAVKESLDLERIDTAYRYVKRYAVQTVRTEL